MLALLQNELVLGGIIVAIVLLLAIWRFIGLKKFGSWIIGNNKPAARAEKAKAKATAPDA